MDKKSGDGWGMRLGLLHVVVLLGVVSGLMVVVFFLGYFAGRNVGYEQAMVASAANAVKMAIPTEDLSDDDELPDAANVYAKLHEQKAASIIVDQRVGENKDEQMPDLGVIPSTEDAPVGREEGIVDAAQEVPPQQLANQELRSSVRAAVQETEDHRNSAMSAGNSAHRDIQQETQKRSLGEIRTEQMLKLDSQQGALPPSVPAQIENDQQRARNIPKNLNGNQQLKREQPAAVQPTPLKKEVEVVQETKKKEELVVPAEVVPANKPAKGFPRGWFAQVAAPKKKSDADALSTKLRESGLPVMIETAQVRGEQYFRVLVGPADSRDGAEGMGKKVKAKKIVSSDPFVRLIK